MEPLAKDTILSFIAVEKKYTWFLKNLSGRSALAAKVGMGSSLDSNSQTRNFAVYLANSHKLETRILTRESRFSLLLREKTIF